MNDIQNLELLNCNLKLIGGFGQANLELNPKENLYISDFLIESSFLLNIKIKGSDRVDID
jgi:hypothetical protein